MSVALRGFGVRVYSATLKSNCHDVLTPVNKKIFNIRRMDHFYS
jgi:hypothetical protein